MCCISLGGYSLMYDTKILGMSVAFWLLLLFVIIGDELNGNLYSETYAYLTTDFDTETTGTITQSKAKTVGSYGGAIEPDLIYSYSINGKSYFGQRLSFDCCGTAWITGGNERTREALNRFPLGAEITVFYDSANPYQSILEKSSLGGSFYRRYFLLLILISLFIFLEKWLGRKNEAILTDLDKTDTELRKKLR